MKAGKDESLDGELRLDFPSFFFLEKQEQKQQIYVFLSKRKVTLRTELGS